MISKKTTLLGLSVGAIFAVLVLSTSIPLVDAEKPIATGKPDFIASIDMPAAERKEDEKKRREARHLDPDKHSGISREGVDTTAGE